MSFELTGFGRAPYLDLPSGYFGYALFGIYALLTLLALAFNLRDFGKLSAARWLSFLALGAAGAALAQTLVVRFPANLLPLPGLVPAFLAGGWFGVGPAIVVGLLTGLARAVWETNSIITPLEFGLLAGVVAWFAQQDYRGLPARFLRHPIAAGLLAGLALWPALYLSYFAYSTATGLAGLDYVNSLARAAAPVFIGQAAIAGIIAELVRLGAPRTWPIRRGSQPPPYVSSLNRKLLFTLIPLFVVGIGLLFWANITVATRVSTTLVVDQMLQAAENAGHGIPFFIQTGRSLARDIAGRSDLLTGDNLLRTARLAESMRALPFFRQVTLYDASRTAVLGYPASPADLPELSETETQVIALALQGIPKDVIGYPRNAGDPVEVLFVAPALDPATSLPAAALVGRADLVSNPLMQSVTQNFTGIAAGAGQGFIVDDRGVIIYHPNANLLLQTFEPEPSALRLRTEADGTLAYQDRAPDGTRRLVVFHPVAGHPWYVVILTPNQVVLALATQIATPIILILLLIGFIGLIVVSIIAGQVTRPAEALALAAQRIAEGQLDVAVNVGSEDEIGRAGLAFERMRAKLRVRLDELGLLLKVSQSVSSTLNLLDGLMPILQGALSATGAAGVRVVLVPGEEPQTSSLGAPPRHQSYALGPAAQVMAPLDEGVLHLTREKGRAVIENLARAKAVLDVGPVAGKLRALLALPLRQETTFHGALWLGYDQPHTFGQAEINFITTLAGQAAVAVANVRLFEAADQGRQRLAAILASTPDAVIVTDRSERVLLLNPAAEAVFGLVGRPAVGRPVSEVLPQPELMRLLKDNRPTAETSEFEIAEGRTLYASASPIIGADGATLGRVCVLRDVTHFKEVDAMKSEFVATVSHDLRAPLTFMRGYATMLPMVGQVNEKQREFGDKIITGIEQMTELIDDLLDLGRIDAGVGLSREACRFDEIVSGVVQRLQTQADLKRLKLSLDIPRDLPTLSGDPTLLRQAVTNLVDNALKYTPEGGEVRLRISCEQSRFTLAVADTGLGIGPADQAHLFEKFFRVKQRGSSQVKGSGLGLAIVKSIVERHGGRVWVTSKLGKGTVFYLEVPQNGAT